MTQFQLSDRVRELIKKSRIVSFATWQDQYSAEIIAYFQNADDRSLYLSDQDLQELQKLDPAIAKNFEIVTLLRDQVSEIINEARAEVLQAFPNITKEGGGLYPPMRADACWRDFWQFLRCITYAIAGQRSDYLSAEGLRSMNELYQELAVPLDAMVLGLIGIKVASLKRIKGQSSEDFAPYFDQLIKQLKKFS